MSSKYTAGWLLAELFWKFSRLIVAGFPISERFTVIAVHVLAVAVMILPGVSPPLSRVETYTLMLLLLPVPPCTQNVIFEYPDVLKPVPLRSESADQPALAMTLMEAVPRLIAVSLKVTVLLHDQFAQSDASESM